MTRSTTHRLARWVGALTASVLIIACSDAPSSPPASAANLGGCTNLQTTPGSTVAAHLYATGVQIYRWNDTAWVFVSPSAVLTSDDRGANAVAIHYSGPTWEGVEGSRVTGSVVGSCRPDANAIPWLLLSGRSSTEPGVFQGAKYIQRVNTTGGLAPSTPGRSGEVVSVPYTAEYFFYRAP
jgi:hypothetical protein